MPDANRTITDLIALRAKRYLCLDLLVFLLTTQADSQAGDQLRNGTLVALSNSAPPECDGFSHSPPWLP